MSGPSKEKMNQIREGKVRTWPILPSRSTDRLGQCPRPLNLADDGDGADESPSPNGDNGIPRHQTVKNGQPRQAGSPSPNGDNGDGRVQRPSPNGVNGPHRHQTVK